MSVIANYGRLIGAAILIMVVLAACVAVVHHGNARYAAGVTDGRNAVLADDARAAAQAQAAHDALDALSAAAGSKLQQHLDAALPTIRGQTHDTVETIRTIYRDRPVPADSCSRPDGVQAQLDAAITRANAAATGGLRSNAAADNPKQGAAAGDVR